MAGILSWLTGNGLRDIGPVAEEVKVLTDQFYITLRAISNKSGQGPANSAPAALTRVNEILNKDRTEWSWSDAYEAEQQLVHLFDDATVKTELARRVLEGRSAFQPAIADWYREEVAKAANGNEQRTLLLRLVNDLQWRYTFNEAQRGYSKEITSRTGWMFILAILSFVGGVMWFYQLGAPPESQVNYLILLAALAGTWGATFSMLTGLKKRLEAASFDDLKLARSWSPLIARMLIGMGAALVLYFFFRSGLLKGEMFPNILDFGQNWDLKKESAVLIVWCFLAGFSEKFIPGLLAKTEGQAAEDRPTLASPEPRASATQSTVQANGAPAQPQPAATNQEQKASPPPKRD